MLYTIIGIFGFVSLLAFDFMSLKNRVFGKYFFAFLGLGLIVYSTFELIQLESDFIINAFLRNTSLLFAIVFMALLIYSVFIEVGGNTYKKFAEPHLVTNGTYSLVRHPGVIWLFLAYLFLAMYNENSYLVFTAIIWSMVNAGYVILQERFILTKLFKDYNEYIRTTPMVIPNIMSLRKFVTTKNWRKE